MSKIEDYSFPKGLHLLTRWQAGDEAARREITAFFDNAIASNLDADFLTLTSPDHVHSTASVHMLGLAVLHDLYIIEPWAYYNTDPHRVRLHNLAVRRLQRNSKH